MPTFNTTGLGSTIAAGLPKAASGLSSLLPYGIGAALSLITSLLDNSKQKQWDREDKLLQEQRARMAQAVAALKPAGNFYSNPDIGGIDQATMSALLSRLTAMQGFGMPAGMGSNFDFLSMLKGQ